MIDGDGDVDDDKEDDKDEDGEFVRPQRVLQERWDQGGKDFKRLFQGKQTDQAGSLKISHNHNTFHTCSTFCHDDPTSKNLDLKYDQPGCLKTPSCQPSPR